MAGLRPTWLTSRRINRADAQDKCRANKPGTSSFRMVVSERTHGVKGYFVRHQGTPGPSPPFSEPVVASGE